jgi:release factor glutamine methyltransferase
VLAPSGTLLIVHSGLSGSQETVQQLAGDGLVVTVAARATVPFGPVMRARADLLQARGLIAPGERTEELVVIRAIKPSQV